MGVTYDSLRVGLYSIGLEACSIDFSHPIVDMLFHDARHLAATTLQMTILNPSHLNRVDPTLASDAIFLDGMIAPPT